MTDGCTICTDHQCRYCPVKKKHHESKPKKVQISWQIEDLVNQLIYGERMEDMETRLKIGEGNRYQRMLGEVYVTEKFKNLTPTAKLIYALFIVIPTEDDWFKFPAKIADGFGIMEQVFYRNIKVLKNAGFIDEKKRGKKGRLFRLSDKWKEDGYGEQREDNP